MPPPAGATLTELPSDAQQVLVGDKLCYIVNGVTYRKTITGYEVMPQSTVVVQQIVTAAPPAVATAEAPQAATTNNTFTVNIPNSKGGFTPVVIKRSGANYIGPQGELYTEFPRVEQLKAMYVK